MNKQLTKHHGLILVFGRLVSKTISLKNVIDWLEFVEGKWVHSLNFPKTVFLLVKGTVTEFQVTLQLKKKMPDSQWYPINNPLLIVLRYMDIKMTQSQRRKLTKFNTL